MYEHNALGYFSGLALCLTKVRSSRARCPATALINTYENGCVHFEHAIRTLQLSIIRGQRYHWRNLD